MSDTAGKRVRWPYVALATFLLVISGAFAWQYRPLNATEQKLIGSWAAVPHPEEEPRRRRSRTLRLTSNRRWSVSLNGGPFREMGSWSATPNEMRGRPDLTYFGSTWPDRFYNAAVFSIKTDNDPIRFGDSDHLWVNGAPYVRLPK